MMETIIVTEDFYTNSEEVREFALRQEFSVKGNFPGARTAPFLNDSVRNTVQRLVGVPITYWPTDTYNGAYQFSTQMDRTWIHADNTTWSGVVYLTPHAPANAGTAFFKHLSTGAEFYPEDPEQRKRCDEDTYISDRWAVTDLIGNRFNRLILFRGRRFHCSQGHFGTCKEDARLFQTFFFNTTY